MGNNYNKYNYITTKTDILTTLLPYIIISCAMVQKI